ncbi:phosphatase PAP2 family protein [Micromonospora sp. NPDC049523]|uniref:phosphatase PAP2 family protein n=1 Tax=Micromonospora sp. NPDC049523 TaxID=3155921 RepID=UPI00341236D5
MIARPPVALPLLALAAFLALFAMVVGGWAPLESFDAAISDAFRGYGDQRPDLVSVLRLATDVAATVPFLVIGAVVSAGLLARAERRLAACCAVVTVVVPVLWSLMHWWVHSPRPSNGFVVVHSNGFPSGHTSNASALALLAVLLLWPRFARTGRVVTVALAAAFAIFIGLTRLALLAHWPADVLGGWLLALAVVPSTVYAVDRIAPRPRVPALSANRAPR